jgi:hypothetical protein
MTGLSTSLFRPGGRTFPLFFLFKFKPNQERGGGCSALLLLPSVSLRQKIKRMHIFKGIEIKAMSMRQRDETHAVYLAVSVSV